MNEYQFTLAFQLPGKTEDPDRYIARLAQFGCEDALVGIGKLGSVSLACTREADDALAAVSSAIEEVQNAIPGAVLVEASPDFVGITDIAEIYGASRQYLRKLIASGAQSFPEPAHEGKPSLWHLAEVLDWLAIHKPERMDAALADVARVTMQVNAYRSLLKASGMRGVAEPVKAAALETAAAWDRIGGVLGHHASSADRPSRPPRASPHSA